MNKKDITMGLYFNKSSRSMRDVIAHSIYYDNVEWRRPNSMNSRACKLSTFSQWADYRVLYLVTCLKDFVIENKTSLLKDKFYPVIAETPVGITIIDETGNEQRFQFAGSSYVSKVQ